MSKASVGDLPKANYQAEKVEKQIGQLQSEIRLRCEEINKQEELLSEYAEALGLVKAKTRWLPQEGLLPPLDAFREHLEDCKTEQERQARLLEIEAGRELALRAHGRLEEELKTLRSHLAELQNDLVWVRDYSHLASRYEDSFPAPPSPQRLKAQTVERLQQNLQQHRLRLERAKSWLDRAQRKQDGSPHVYLEVWSYAAPPSQVVQTYPQIITQMERSLADEMQRIVPEDGQRDPKTEQAFREYVIARVRLEKPLQQLLQAQMLYKQALVDFRQAASENPQGLPFPVADLPTMPIKAVAIKSNEIFLEVDENAQLQARRHPW
jgi:tetratricopeptide (TPR) repeat protein